MFISAVYQLQVNPKFLYCWVAKTCLFYYGVRQVFFLVERMGSIQSWRNFLSQFPDMRSENKISFPGNALQLDVSETSSLLDSEDSGSARALEKA
jgi:hypothetical protein